MYRKLEKLKLFDHPDSNTAFNINNPYPLRENVEQTYRNIFNSREKGDPTHQATAATDKTKLTNAKLIKRYLVNYLKQRYNIRVAQKISSIFDWS